jgi:hypothetical protein
MKVILLALIVSGFAFAKNDLTHRPKSFSTGSGKAVFVDFITADYDISYNAENRSSSVTATINFDVPESGMPIFDSVEAPMSIMLDGAQVSAIETKTPSNETTLRVINKVVNTGSHSMTIKVPLSTLVEYKAGGIKSAFWTSDLSERRFLERYMPANLEYDQVKMTFNVFFEGNKTAQKIYTNGKATEKVIKGKNATQISFPEYFNASSIFFHTVPEGTTDELRFTLKSVDGRDIPAVVYVAKSVLGGSLSDLKDAASAVFHELEGDYGAWPHPVLVVYNAGSGGMEYCGATMTATNALGHEMFHSYFARGVMPANGNSGWLDEALASWRDDGYQTETSMTGTSGMSSHPYYTRTTDYAAYSFGAKFMSYMDGKTKAKGGLKPFMRHMVENRRFAPLWVEEFAKEMSEFYGESLDVEFRKYTFGNKNFFPPEYKSQNAHIHKKMSIEELQNYL